MCLLKIIYDQIPVCRQDYLLNFLYFLKFERVFILNVNIECKQTFLLKVKVNVIQ